MTNLLSQAVTQPTGGGGSNVNPWLYALIELAKVCVIFAGGYFAHWLVIGRDKRGRKKTFLAFMEQLKGEMINRHHPPNTYGDFYTNKIPNLRHAAALMSGDFDNGRNARFDELIAAACDFNGAQADSAQGKEATLKCVDAIIGFLREPD